MELSTSRHEIDSRSVVKLQQNLYLFYAIQMELGWFKPWIFLQEQPPNMCERVLEGMCGGFLLVVDGIGLDFGLDGLVFRMVFFGWND